jgi:hypothetical protein
MYGSHSTVTVCDWSPHCHYISAHCNSVLPICAVATVQLLYAIGVLTVTISVHTVTNMYGSHSTVTVCDRSPRCHNVYLNYGTVTKLTSSFRLFLYQCFSQQYLSVPCCKANERNHIPGAELLFPLVLYTPRPLCSTEVGNDLQNAKHKPIPSASTDPACVLYFHLCLRRQGPPFIVSNSASVFFLHTVYVYTVLTDISCTDHKLIFLLLYSTHCCSSHVTPSDQQTVLRYTV